MTKMNRFKMPKEQEAHGLPGLKIVVTGTSRDLRLEEMLSESGNETTFIQLNEDLSDVTQKFSFVLLQEGIRHAREHQFDMVLASDKKYNKLSCAVRKSPNEGFVLLSAHQLAALFTHHGSISMQTGELQVVKSIHVSDLVENIAVANHQDCISKVIAPDSLERAVTDLEESLEGKRVLGFTEHQQFCDSSQDLYQLIAQLVVMAQEARSQQQTLHEKMNDLYLEYGFYKEKTFAVDIVNKDQGIYMMDTMNGLRRNPAALNQYFPVKSITDYSTGKAKNFLTEKVSLLNEEKIKIFRMEFINGLSVTFVPSNEKMVYHLSMKTRPSSLEQLADEGKNMDQKIMRLIQILNSL